MEEVRGEETGLRPELHEIEGLNSRLIAFTLAKPSQPAGTEIVDESVQDHHQDMHRRGHPSMNAVVATSVRRNSHPGHHLLEIMVNIKSYMIYILITLPTPIHKSHVFAVYNPSSWQRLNSSE